MKHFLLSSDADADLQDIYDYTEDMWGEAQAEKYIGDLYRVFDLLSGNPSLGRQRPELAADIRSFASGAHVIFYMTWQNETAIVRVLHGSRDIEAIFLDYEPGSGMQED